MTIDSGFQAQLLRAVGEAVIVTDLDGTVTYWNPAAEALYGWTREEVVGRSIMEVTTPATTRRQAEEIMDMLRAGQVWRGEFEVSRKDGSTFCALVANSPVWGDDGRLHGIIGVSSDITDLKKTQAELRERVKELRILHDVGRIMNDAEVPVDERLQRVVETLPSAWLDPEVTEACLTLDQREFKSAGYQQTEWVISAPVDYGERETGRISVVVTAPRPTQADGPFLREERELLDHVARTIGDALKRERAARLQASTVAALNEAVFTVVGRVVLDVNPAALRIFGYSREELVGKTTDMFHVDRETFERFGRQSEQALERDGVFHGKFALRRRDGTPFPAEQTVTLLDPAVGHEGGVVSVVRDVSEQVRAETELRASEERFRQIAESIDDVFWISSPDRSRMEYVSPAFARVWGRPVEDLTQDPVRWMEWLLPSDKDRVAAALSVQHTAGYEIEYRIVRPDGDIRWIFDRAFPFRGPDGQVARIIGVAEDITERKLAEERFAVLSQEIAEGIHVIAPDGLILFATPSSGRVLGYPPDELEGRNALDLVHPEDRAMLADMIRGIVHAPGRVAQAQYRGITMDGQFRHLESVGRSRLDHPAIRGVVVTTRDITERLRLEEQLRQSQKMEAVGRLAGGIAHDFNNLLTVIRSQTDLILMDVVADEALRNDLETIQGAADRAAALTSQLLAFSREQILQPRVVDLSQIVHDMARLLERVIGEDVALIRELEPALPPIRVDPGQLEQAVMNLAVNARDAMPRGGELTLRTRLHTVHAVLAGVEPRGTPAACVVLEVSDNGMGMDTETQSHIFEPFYTTKEKGKGTGLGLAMVYGVVAQSGGEIEVDSAPGKGSTFRLSFPPVEAEPEPPQEPVQKPAATPMAHARVLVVEDDDAVRRVTVRVLQRVGIDVEAVSSGEAAMDALGDPDGFDLLITDLVLPGLSGRALVDHIREGGSPLPIIVMSGYAEDSTPRMGDLPEGVHFVQKPFTPDVLVESVRTALGG